MSHKITPERAKRGFLIHLTVYVLVNILLAVIDLRTNPEKTWFYWPLACWGIGLIAHGLAVYGMRVPHHE
jgi:hypothetical protein